MRYGRLLCQLYRRSYWELYRALRSSCRSAVPDIWRSSRIYFISRQTGIIFDVMLHLGTLVAIFVVYRKDILRMIVETVNMCGDIIYNLKSYIQNQRSYSALRYRKIVKTTIASLWYWCWYLPYRQVSLVISEREWWKKRVRH